MSIHRGDASYIRPILSGDPALGTRGTVLAGGALRFSEVCVDSGAAGATVVPAAAAAALYPDSASTLARLSRPRPALGALAGAGPHALAALVPGEAAQARLWAGAAALLVTVDVDAPPAVEDLRRLHQAAPVLLRGAAPALAAAAGVAAWQAGDWRAMAAAALPEACQRIAPAPAGTLDDAAAVRRLFDATAAALAALESVGGTRAGVIVDLGRVAAPALGSLALMHGLGCTLMADLGPAAGPHAAAAAAVLAAGQGVQLLSAPDTAALAGGLALWRATMRP